MTNPAFERILVTGGTGFFGRHVIDLLTSEGYRPLITNFGNEHLNEKPQSASVVDVVSLDLTDHNKTRDLVDKYRPQIVIHLAGVTGHNDPTGKLCHKINFEATVNLLNALDQIGADRVVMIGSAAEYGSQPIPFRETMPARPVSEYGISKAEANKYAIAMHERNGFPVTILRVFSAYGYRQPPKMFLSQLITHGLSNRHFMMSDGTQRRDFVHIEDVATAVNAAIRAENAPGKIFNIGTGQSVPLRHLARIVWDACGADDSLLDIGAREKTGDESFDTGADITMAEQILEWRPKFQILDGDLPGDALSDMIIRTKEDLRLSSTQN